MKIQTYIGIDGQVIIIERHQDLFPLLDWFHTQLMDRGANDEALNYISDLMDRVEKHGYGSQNDIDDIEYF